MLGAYAAAVITYVLTGSRNSRGVAPPTLDVSDSDLSVERLTQELTPVPALPAGRPDRHPAAVAGIEARGGRLAANGLSLDLPLDELESPEELQLGGVAVALHDYADDCPWAVHRRRMAASTNQPP